MRVITALGLALLAPVALSQAEQPESTVTTQAVAPGVWMLIGRGGNIGVSAGPDGVFLIDDQYAAMTEPVGAALKALHPAPPRFVLNTHWHGDHTGGNENLGKAGTIIVAHENVRARMSTEQFISFLKRTDPPAPAAALPVVTFSDQVTFYLNGDEIHGTHVKPAHTDGDTFIHFRKSNVIHAGDLFFRFYPFIDGDSGGSVSGLIAAVEKVLSIADENTKIIPGHGPLATRADLAEYRDMLAVTSGRIRELVKAGKTADEIVALTPNADYDAKWGWEFITPERYSRMLHGLISKELKAGRT